MLLCPARSEFRRWSGNRIAEVVSIDRHARRVRPDLAVRIRIEPEIPGGERAREYGRLLRLDRRERGQQHERDQLSHCYRLRQRSTVAGDTASLEVLTSINLHHLSQVFSGQDSLSTAQVREALSGAGYHQARND